MKKREKILLLFLALGLFLFGCGAAKQPPSGGKTERLNLYGVDFGLEDEELDLSYIRIGDGWRDVLKTARRMPNLKRLVMDSCGVQNEDMAVIRDALPETEVIWRINFGLQYTARTDATRILASSPSIGGNVTNRDLEKFRYFTKLRFLDIGHNEDITDLSFVRYLPDLEVLIIAMNPLGDLTPLADCEKLEYLELFYSRTDDLSPLAGLKNLKHLNVGHCPMLKDISPIYDLELERFFLGPFLSCPVPQEQVDHYRELHPDCEVENEYWESSEGTWRRAANLTGEKLEWYQKQPYYSEERKGYAPRYALLRDQMEYDTLNYSIKANDPFYQRPNSAVLVFDIRDQFAKEYKHMSIGSEQALRRGPETAKENGRLSSV